MALNSNVTDLPECTSVSSNDVLYLVDKSLLTDSAQGSSTKVQVTNLVTAALLSGTTMASNVVTSSLTRVGNSLTFGASDRSRLSQTLGGLNTVIGVNVQASASVSNQINTTLTSSDGASGMLFSYEKGIIGFASDGPSTAGASFYAEGGDISKQVFRFYPNGCKTFGPYAGDTDPKFTIFYGDLSHIALVQKASGHGSDLNYLGGCMVTHSHSYSGTPGYGGTTQFYAFAGSQAAVLGCNSFVEEASPYFDPPPSTITPNGCVRVEVGPLWPDSEVWRWNPTEALAANTFVRDLASSSQSGTTVTCSTGSFTILDTGLYVCWGDYTLGGIKAYSDQILEVLSSTTVRVGISRTISSQYARLCQHYIRLTDEGDIYANSLFVKGPVDGIYSVQVGSTSPGYDNGGRINFYGAGPGYESGSGIIAQLTSVYDSTDATKTTFVHEGSTVFTALGTQMTFHGKVIHALSQTPASSGATGTAGTISWDSSYIYVCISTNTWKRCVLSSW